MTIQQLKNKWNKEKNFYRNQEVGTGIHSFVREFLESTDLFSLQEGSLSSKSETRKNEYIHENKAKEGRKADFVIYVNSDIVIPLEAECYENIKAGIQQIFNYQKDFEKHYGILTDGYAWRFYNNNAYREFSLDQILDEPEIFLEFWKEYIKPEFYYLSFFEPQGQLALLKEIDTLQVEEHRQLFFEDITQLIKSFKNKLQVEGYFVDLDKKEREKKAVEITYAYVIQFVLYKTLVDNAFGEFSQEFTETVEAIHECLKAKQYGKVLTVTEGISNNISKNIYRPFKKEQDFINQLLIELIRKPKNELHEVAPWLDIFVFIKKYSFANIQNEIFGYIYENYLKVLYEDENKGQYFTDPAVVNFMLQQVGFTQEDIKERYEVDKNSISLIDPACGSGTFLYSAVNSIAKAFDDHSLDKSQRVETLVNDNIFGLDIAEFPLYLAEMSILMRMLPLIIGEKYNNPVDKKIKVFKTMDSISEFRNTALRNTLNDQSSEFQKKTETPGQIQLFTEKLNLGYSSYVRDESDLEEMKRSLEEHLEVPRRRFDYVVGNPPYVSYNECSRQGVLIVKLIQEKKASMGDIYGVNLNTVPGRTKAYSPKPNLYSFFIALGLALLKDNGKLCYIVPQTLLSANDLDVLRYHLSKYTTIEKIITFNSPLFMGRGLRQKNVVATSSMIFVVSRKIPSLDNKVLIIDYEGSDENADDTFKNILQGELTAKKQIKQQDLLINVNNWNFIKQDQNYIDFYESYKKYSEDIFFYRAKLKPEDDFFFDGGVIIDEDQITEGSSNENFELFEYKNNNWSLYTVSRSDHYYPSNSTIKFPEGSQGINTYKKKFKVIWRTKFTNNFQFTDRNLLLVNNQSLIVSSNSESELLFLFALLNSKINKLVLEKNLKQENEKNYLVPLRAIKSYVRIPNFTSENIYIKQELINLSHKLVSNEKSNLEDFVDFTGVLKQKFDTITVEGHNLILEKSNEKLVLQITHDTELIDKSIKSVYGEDGLLFNNNVFALSKLKSLPIIDFERQQKTKELMDDLIFCLYFNVNIPEDKVSNAEYIHSRCSQSPYYSLV